MSLADDIRLLKNRATVELVAAHDYFADTRTAWRLVNDLVQSGARFSDTNSVTGTVTPQTDLVQRSQLYSDQRILEATFTDFISIFESWFFDFLRLWLTAYPQRLGGRKVEFQTVLDLPDKPAIIAGVVDREAYEVLYDRPASWFAYLNRLASLTPSDDEIEQFAEAKASRDVLVHNRGIVTTLYLNKAGSQARFTLGQRLDIVETYHRNTWNLLQKVVNHLSDAGIAKF